jgi:hypothetical protein
MLKTDPACKETFATNKLLPVVPGNPCGATAEGCPYPDKMCTGDKKESGVCTDVPPECKSKLSPKVAKDAKSGNGEAKGQGKGESKGWAKGQATTAATMVKETTAGSMQKATTAGSMQKATTAGSMQKATTAATAGAVTTASPTAKDGEEKPKNAKEVTKDVTDTGGKVTMDVAKGGVNVVSDIASASGGRKKRNVGRKL